MNEPGRLGPPPIEPLSDLAWARIERGVWAKLDDEVEAAPMPRHHHWPWIAAPLLAAAAIVIALVIPRGGGGDLALAPDPAAPTRLVSGASPSSLTYGDAHVTLDPESAIVLTTETSAATAILERGAAWFAIAERKRPFVVMAGDVVVRVVGTRFRVSRDADHASVEVERGIVEVRYRGIEERLVAGQHWSSRSGSAVVQPTQPITPVAPPVVAPPVVAPPVVAPPVIAPPVVTPPTAPAKQPPITTTATSRREFERLSALEARDPKAAITGYLSLARGTDRWAELALFAAARLASDHRDSRARNLLETYLRRFPRGANTDDARELLAPLKRPAR